MTTGRRSNSTDATSLPSPPSFAATGAAAAEELKPRGCRRSDRSRRLAVVDDRDSMVGSGGRVRGPRRAAPQRWWYCGKGRSGGGRTLPKGLNRGLVGLCPSGPQARFSVLSLSLPLGFLFLFSPNFFIKNTLHLSKDTLHTRFGTSMIQIQHAYSFSPNSQTLNG